MNKAAEERIPELTAIVKMLVRARFGMRSERQRGEQPSDESAGIPPTPAATLADFKPIEMAFTKLKTLLRKAAARTIDDRNRRHIRFVRVECWNYLGAGWVAD